MITKIRIIYMVIFILILLPHISMATPPGLTTILGVTIHLKNNENLNGYIEVASYLNACDKNSDDYEEGDDYQTLKVFLAKQGDFRSLSDGRDTIRFIDKLIEIQYGNVSRPVITKSNIKLIKMDDIRSIESVCKKWDGRKTTSGIPKITDYMAGYISNHKLVAFYIYNPEAIAEAKDNAERKASDAAFAAEQITYKTTDEDIAEAKAEAEVKAKEAAEAKALAEAAAEELYDPSDYARISTYLSYNANYTKKKLIKLRKIIDKMPSHKLDEEKLIIFTEYFD